MEAPIQKQRLGAGPRPWPCLKVLCLRHESPKPGQKWPQVCEWPSSAFNSHMKQNKRLSHVRKESGSRWESIPVRASDAESGVTAHRVGFFKFRSQVLEKLSDTYIFLSVTCVHTCTCSCMHAHRHVHTRTYAHTHTRAHMHTHAHFLHPSRSLHQRDLFQGRRAWGRAPGMTGGIPGVASSLECDPKELL